MEQIRLRNDGTLSLYEVMKYKYLNNGWAVEYADENGVYGMGDPLSGAERLLWEDEGEAPVQADLEKEKPIIKNILGFQKLRYDRDIKLAETDWVVTKANETGIAESNEWKTYRQALRDLPSNTTDPFNPTWPTKPS
tara:strand:+ start:991 stop:1401 length:411 start_codon:yes stop_codon:yes gene_type:complete